MKMTDTTKNFDGYAKDYTVGRPSYAKELLDSFYDFFGIEKSSVIADIGSGTGKFARHLLDYGNDVYCVEPNEDMRNVAEDELNGFDNFHSVGGGAENTTLKDSSVDFITTAQAFHWFDVDKFRSECRRILRENGKVFLIWNVRDMDEKLNQELYDIYKKYCKNFKGFSGGIVKDDERIKKFFDGKYEYVEYDNPLFFDKNKFIARSLSGSYSLKEGDDKYEEYLKEIIDVFNRYSKNGILSMGNKSVAYVGCVD